MKYPTKVKIKEKEYKINTDFRVAIECNEIALDTSISDFERALAIIYKLYGDEGLNDWDNHDELIRLGLKYLGCGKEVTNYDNNTEPDMDYIEDEGYIRSSFQYDYKYDPYELDYLHWYKYFNDLCNLSNSEMGDCCVLNRIRNLRTYDLSQISDVKEREKIRKAKEQVSLKKFKKETHLTEEQEKSMEELNKILGF